MMFAHYRLTIRSFCGRFGHFLFISNGHGCSLLRGFVSPLHHSEKTILYGKNPFATQKRITMRRIGENRRAGLQFPIERFILSISRNIDSLTAQREIEPRRSAPLSDYGSNMSETSEKVATGRKNIENAIDLPLQEPVIVSWQGVGPLSPLRPMLVVDPICGDQRYKIQTYRGSDGRGRGKQKQ